MLIRFQIEGTEPLLLHSQRGANTRDPLVREMKNVQGKRSKMTDEDLDRLADIEYELGLYHDPEIGVYLPFLNLKRCIQDAAKKAKRGKDIDAGLWPVEGTNKLKLLYDGPQDLPGLIADPAFRDARMAGVNNGLILRTRPKFEKWRIDAQLELDESIMDPDVLQHYIVEAGKKVGLGDYRPAFGRFRLSRPVECAANGKHVHLDEAP